MLNRGLKSSRPENDRLFNQPGSTNVSAVRFGVNIAPSQSILVLLQREGEEKPRYARMRWTFVGSHHDPEAAPLPANARPSPLDAVLNVIRGSALGSATIAAEFVAKLALANSTFWQASQKNNEANRARLLAKSTAPQESQYHVFLPNSLDRLPLSLLTDPISERAKLRPACIFITRLLRSSIEATMADPAAPNQRAEEMEDCSPLRRG